MNSSSYRICRNKHPGRLILRSNEKDSKTRQKPSVLCTPPFEKSPIKSHRFCVLPPLKNHPSKAIGFVYSPLWKIPHQSPSVLCTPLFENHPLKAIGFVYSPLWKIIHQSPSVLCTPPFEKSLFLMSAYFGKYGISWLILTHRFIYNYYSPRSHMWLVT